MNRRDIEQLTDELIGKAVLLLLKRKAPVNSMALLSQLRAMQETETDVRRRAAFPLIIAYIEALTANQKESQIRPEKNEKRDGVDVLSGYRQQPGKGKIH